MLGSLQAAFAGEKELSRLFHSLLHANDHARLTWLI